MQIFVRLLDSRTAPVDVPLGCSVADLKDEVARLSAVPQAAMRLVCGSRDLEGCSCHDAGLEAGDTVSLRLRVVGGIDFQHREGSKFGGGGVSSEQEAARERKERLRKLALETIDLDKDPYFMKNHLGSFECKLCLTLHTTEGNYLAHTQGKRHQQNLGRRAAREEQMGLAAKPQTAAAALQSGKATIKIGRPGYRITKARDPESTQRTLGFEVDYPEAEDGVQPRHRFMSAYEQRVEAPDKNYQYLLVACEPYETIAFKIPSDPLDKGEGKFNTAWDELTKKFTVQLAFATAADLEANRRLMASAAGAPKRTVRALATGVLA